MIDIEIAKAIQPYFIYGDFTLPNRRNDFTYTVPYGFNYLLRRLTASWPQVSAGGAYNDPLEIEFFSSRGRANQSQPIPLGLIASPAGAFDVAIPAAFPTSYTVSRMRNHVTLNTLYAWGETIDLHITGQNGTDPASVRLVLKGYLIPQKTLEFWGGNK